MRFYDVELFEMYRQPQVRTVSIEAHSAEDALTMVRVNRMGGDVHDIKCVDPLTAAAGVLGAWCPEAR